MKRRHSRKVLSRTTKESETGFCNGCNQHDKLTWDHVPPQGSVDLKPVEVSFFVDHLHRVAKHPVEQIIVDGVDQARLHLKNVSQNGLKFHTLCTECNIVRLGTRYDPELNRVSKEIAKLVRAAFEAHLRLPFTIEIPVRTHLLLRAVVGHLLAAHGSMDQQKPLPGFDTGFYRELRDYFLDESLPIPPGVRLYYWPYPGTAQVAITGLALADRKGGPYVMGDLLKFSPVAFFVVNHRPDSLALRVPWIRGDGCNELNCTVSLYFDVVHAPPFDWPETPTARHYTMMPVQSSHVAVSRSRSRD